jgi:hypothetical protein
MIVYPTSETLFRGWEGRKVGEGVGVGVGRKILILFSTSYLEPNQNIILFKLSLLLFFPSRI